MKEDRNRDTETIRIGGREIKKVKCKGWREGGEITGVEAIRNSTNEAGIELGTLVV